MLCVAFFGLIFDNFLCCLYVRVATILYPISWHELVPRPLVERVLDDHFAPEPFAGEPFAVEPLVVEPVAESVHASASAHSRKGFPSKNL